MNARIYCGVSHFFVAHSKISPPVAWLIALFAALLTANSAVGQQPISLLTPGELGRGWSFNNGAEFRGATGSLQVDSTVQREGRDSLRLIGDFTGGGRYVQAGRNISNIDIRELSLWLKTENATRLTIRLNDASGQTHQIAIATAVGNEWQNVVLPLERFFARRGQADAVTSILKYESWGGAKDGKWHGPAKAIYILLGNPEGNVVRKLWLNEVSITPPPMAVPGAEIVTKFPLDEINAGAHDWRFTNGQEFPGAKGALSVVADQPTAGQTSLQLAGDFTGGGAYVAAVKDLQTLEIPELSAIQVQYKTENAETLGVQLVDSTGQTHQSRLKLTADNQWNTLEIKPQSIAGGEHWGGAKDGKWHGPAKQVSLSLPSNGNSKTKTPTLLLHEIRAVALLPVFVQAPALKSTFEALTELPANWKFSPGVTIDNKQASQGTQSLLLTRTLEQVEQPSYAVSPAFAVSPGKWELSLACKSELHSPDNSYSGTAKLEVLNAAGSVIETVTLADVFGQKPWQSLAKRAELPSGAAQARLRVELNKTYGQFWVDEFSAAQLAPALRKDDRVVRLLFSTAQLGNLLLPTDPKVVTLSVEATKPLRDGQRKVQCEVRDYWGAEQAQPLTVLLDQVEVKEGRQFYTGKLDLAAVPLEVGRYYEIHATLAQPGDEPFQNHTSFAILPPAETHRYKPEEVPFTARNWDNRIPEYIELTNRLGVRVCGLWGGWSSKPPYKPEAPRLEMVQKLGMGWLSTTPIATIERGKTDYTETALREGVRNFLQEYGKFRPIINLGNEPHGTGAKVLANVKAYQTVYEEIKKVDPTIYVVATSVEPNEEYFAAGYGKWCDAYDFHIYESAADVRRTMREYRALAKKYGHEKPIWSTELGLNSQGMTRHVVAVELIKKFSSFFAEGGANVCWFGLLYPDPDGKSSGSSGDSHNIFDCRFKRYAPRLDAVAYYHAVNAIAVKKFIGEKQYPNGVHAFLFRDAEQRTLQVLWKEQGRNEIYLPLTGVQEVELIRIDGRHRQLVAAGEGLTLSITTDPVMLLYQGGAATLPETLPPALAELQPLPAALPRGGVLPLQVTTAAGSKQRVELLAPRFWQVERVANGNPQQQHFAVTAPATSAAHAADFTVQLLDSEGRCRGELTARLPISK